MLCGWGLVVLGGAGKGMCHAAHVAVMVQPWMGGKQEKGGGEEGGKRRSKNT